MIKIINIRQGTNRVNRLGLHPSWWWFSLKISGGNAKFATSIAHCNESRSAAPPSSLFRQLMLTMRFRFRQAFSICFDLCPQKAPNRFRPRLCPGPRWESSRRSTDLLVSWGEDTLSTFPTPLGAPNSRRRFQLLSGLSDFLPDLGVLE